MIFVFFFICIFIFHRAARTAFPEGMKMKMKTKKKTKRPEFLHSLLDPAIPVLKNYGPEGG